MKFLDSKAAVVTALAAFTALAHNTVVAQDIATAISSGKASLDVRLRYESAKQDNVLDDAKALTVRSRLGYTTGSLNGLSATLELEDNRVVLGQDDYAVPPVGQNTGEFSVIADPEFTEIDQAYLQYKTDLGVLRGGRQVITLDNHRFVGHVGWRQDRQTYDGISVKLNPMYGVSTYYAWLSKRNGIFDDARDQDSRDHLLNVSGKTPIGKLTGYAYLLETDDTGVDSEIDTIGLRLSGKAQLTKAFQAVYALEYADQDFEDDTGADFSASYSLVELGLSLNGGAQLTVAQETLGSDDGGYGFATPLATLHKFNGWADTFLVTPTTGLIDTCVALSSPIAGGKLVIAYHQFDADDDTPLLDDYGNEWNGLYSYSFSKNYSAGIKYASYSAEDRGVDTERLWVWVQAKF